jgi:hypothetical protein
MRKTCAGNVTFCTTANRKRVSGPIRHLAEIAAIVGQNVRRLQCSTVAPTKLADAELLLRPE